MPSEPRFRDSLRRLPPRVWMVSAGMLVNRAGNFLPVFIVLYLTTSRGFSPSVAGLVLGSAGLGFVFGNLAGGYLADRIGRRWTIALSAVTNAALTASIPLYDTLPLIVIVVALVGLASQMHRPAAAALLVDSAAGRQQRVAAFAVFRLAMNLGAAVGGVVGGWLAVTSYTWLFLSEAIAALLFGLLTALLVRDVSQANDTRPQAGQERAGYREALADRRLRRFLLMTLVAEFVYIQSTVGLPLHVVDVGLNAANFGMLIGFNGTLVLLLELPIASVVAKRRHEYVLAVGNLVTGLGLALTVFATNMPWLATTVLLWTFGEMMYGAVANAHVGSLAPSHLVGRYQGLYGMVFTLGIGIGPLIGGVVYAASSWAFWALVGAAGLWSAQLCLPGRRPRAPDCSYPADCADRRPRCGARAPDREG